MAHGILANLTLPGEQVPVTLDGMDKVIGVDGREYPLKPIDRDEVLRLRQQERLSSRAIANRLGCSVTTVQRVLREARANT